MSSPNHPHFPNPAWIIHPTELREELARGNITLVDVREQEEWDESRIEGAQFIPLSDFMNLAPRELKDHDADIVIYCAHGVRSMHALKALTQMGFTRLRSLEGGISAWQEQK